MKKIGLIVVIFGVSSVAALAQNDAISKLFKNYYDDDQFTKVSVSSKMFDLFTEIEPGDENEKEFLAAISKLEGLKVLAADSVGNSKKLYDDVVKKISGNGYEELMEVKDAQEDMKFMIRESNGVISELVMVVGGKKSFVLISLYGVIDLKSISKLSRGMNIKGMEHLKRMEDKKNSK